MPMMYALGQHDGLDEARTLLPPSDALVVYLDDIYLLTQEQHARASFDTATHCIKTNCGVDVNLGKCVAWSHAGGPAPAGLEGFWRGDRCPEENGLVILGTPLGAPEFTHSFLARRLIEESILLDRIPLLSDLQSA